MKGDIFTLQTPTAQSDLWPQKHSPKASIYPSFFPSFRRRSLAFGETNPSHEICTCTALAMGILASSTVVVVAGYTLFLPPSWVAKLSWRFSRKPTETDCALGSTLDGEGRQGGREGILGREKPRNVTLRSTSPFAVFRRFPRIKALHFLFVS